MSGASAALTDQLHASAVCLGTSGCLILGAAGRGKSTLAFELMAYGAVLVADDRVDLTCTPGGVVMSAPPPIRGLIEARGVGMMQVPAIDRARLVLVVDLDLRGGERLPPLRTCEHLGVTFPLIHGYRRPALAAIVIGALRAGGLLNPDHHRVLDPLESGT